VTKPCVVVADDNESLRYLTVHVLEDHADAPRFDVEEAEDGAAALVAVERRLAQGARVLLVSDNRMPNMTGLDLVRALRARHAADAVRVTVLTSAEPPDATAEEMGALAVSLVERPADLNALRGILGRVVQDWLRG